MGARVVGHGRPGSLPALTSTAVAALLTLIPPVAASDSGVCGWCEFSCPVPRRRANRHRARDGPDCLELQHGRGAPAGGPPPGRGRQTFTRHIRRRGLIAGWERARRGERHRGRALARTRAREALECPRSRTEVCRVDPGRLAYNHRLRELDPDPLEPRAPEGNREHKGRQRNPDGPLAPLPGDARPRAPERRSNSYFQSDRPRARLQHRAR